MKGCSYANLTLKLPAIYTQMNFSHLLQRVNIHGNSMDPHQTALYIDLEIFARFISTCMPTASMDTDQTAHLGPHCLLCTDFHCIS